MPMPDFPIATMRAVSASSHDKVTRGPPSAGGVMDTREGPVEKTSSRDGLDGHVHKIRKATQNSEHDMVWGS